jgi:hypothetical protein
VTNTEHTGLGSEEVAGLENPQVILPHQDLGNKVGPSPGLLERFGHDLTATPSDLRVGFAGNSGTGAPGLRASPSQPTGSGDPMGSSRMILTADPGGGLIVWTFSRLRHKVRSAVHPSHCG